MLREIRARVLTYFPYLFLLAVVNISLAQFVDGVLKVPENQEESRVEVQLSEAVNLGNVSWSVHITFKLLIFVLNSARCPQVMFSLHRLLSLLNHLFC